MLLFEMFGAFVLLLFYFFILHKCSGHSAFGMVTFVYTYEETANECICTHVCTVNEGEDTHNLVMPIDRSTIKRSKDRSINVIHKIFIFDAFLEKPSKQSATISEK